MISEKFETVLSLLDNPKETIELIIVEGPIFFSLIIFILANLSFLTANYILHHSVSTNFFFILAIMLLFNLLFLITTAAGYHFIGEMLKGKGNVLALFSLLNFSLVPMLLMIPFAIIGKTVGSGLSYFAFMIIFCWTIYLVIYSIKMLYDISLLKTLFVILSPIIIVFFFSAIFLITTAAGIISLFI